MSNEERVIESVLGERCAEFDADCMTCVAWKLLDERNRFGRTLQNIADEDGSKGDDMKAWAKGALGITDVY